MGDRPVELAAALSSVRSQGEVTAELVVVANGVPATAIDIRPDDHVVVEPVENLGIPGGRNAGAAGARAPIIAFLDDDARLVDHSVLARCVARFGEQPRLGAIALRLVDERGYTARRHVPRIGTGNPARSGPVTAFLGGAVVMRAATFHDVGGYPADFMYSMEETDLSLRLIDRGWAIYYDGRPAVFHPETEPRRHHGATAQTMRNRVWLAHRVLPVPLAVVYVVNWLFVSIVRSPRDTGTLVRAVIGGWRTRIGPRTPIRWRTVLRLTRLGRPPIV